MRPGEATGSLGVSLLRMFMAVACAYFLLPLVLLVFASTKTLGDLNTSFGLWFGPEGFHLFDNVAQLFTFQDGIFTRWLLNSLLYAAVGGAAAAVVASMAGYALAKYRFRGRNLVFQFVLAGVLMPSTLLVIPQFILFAKIGLNDTIWAMLLPGSISVLGVYVSRVFAEAAVHDDLMDAARLDGAGELRIFASIALPLLRPAMVTVFLLQFVAIWNNLLLPQMVLSSPGLFSVTAGLNVWLNSGFNQPGIRQVVIAGSLVSTLPLVVGFIALQRYWRAGVAVGAIKG
jgi:multiple sugar transport system permease protein